MNDCKVTKLANGLRVASVSMASVGTVSVGVWVGAGARSESQSTNGVAHFLEHMAFKGTRGRTALDIALAVDAVGGHFNAWTARESTAYYMKLLSADLPLGVDILADILLNPVFDAAELERERGVILQEIGQTMDTPDDLVFDLLQETAFPGQPMGWSILGPAEGIRSLPRDALTGFMQAHYRAGNMVLAAAGDLDHDRLVALAASAFAGLADAPVPGLRTAAWQGGERREQRKTEQVHFTLGFPGVPQNDPASYDATALAVLLGGGMSSRLFQEVREKRGLAYAVQAFTQSFEDSGLFGIYAGTGEDGVAELVPVVCGELLRLADSLTEDEVSRARTQMKAGLMMEMESTGGRASRLGGQMLAYGRPMEPPEIIARIDAVTVTSVAAAARRIFSGPPALAAVGPLKRLESLDGIRARLAA